MKRDLAELSAGMERTRTESFYGCKDEKQEEKPIQTGITERGLWYQEFPDYIRITGCEEGMRDLEIPAEIAGKPVIIIGEHAFYKHETITDVKIPEGVRVIENGAFMSMPCLKNISVPESVSLIGRYAFSYCSLLETAVLGGNRTVIGENAFFNDKSLKNVTLREGTSEIGEEVFHDCELLKTLIIPVSVVCIKGNPAPNCDSLMSICIPGYNPYYQTINGVLYSIADRELIAYPSGRKSEDYSVLEGTICIGKEAFMGCDHLKSVILPNGIIEISECAFKFCYDLQAISLPEGLQIIQNGAFSNCRQLLTITLPEGLQIIKDDAFSSCYKLTQLTLPEGLNEIGAEAFENCEELKDIHLPDTLQSMGRNIFRGCKALSVLEIPRNLKELGIPVGKMSALTELRISQENPYFRVTDNVLFTSDGSTLLWYLPYNEGNEYAVSDAVEHIGEYAFEDSNLEVIVMKNNVHDIGERAFRDCRRLKTIRLPDRLNVISVSMLGSCSSLTKVRIPDSVTEIRTFAFSFCSNLSEIYIPKSVRVIGENAFWNDPLVTVYYEGTREDWESISFEDDNEELLGAKILFEQEPPSDSWDDIEREP